MRKLTIAVLTLILGAGLALAQVSHSAVDQQIASSLQQQFSSKKDLANVHPTVEDRVVTLNGTVPSYRAELEAIHDAKGADNVNGYISHLKVAGPTVPDSQLRREISDRLTYDRIGMGQTFNALTVQVHNGRVTVGGNVRDYADRDSAIDIVADTKGVKGVVDKINVAPLSPMDDQIRLEAAQRIYGNPTLSKYASDPAHPIRILVSNAHVTLAGVVNSKVDKQVAGNAVRGLPGVLSVTNDLVVAH